MAVQTDAAIGCMLVDWGKKGLEGKTAGLINPMRRRGLDMPIVMLVRRKRLEDIPVEVLDYIDGYIFLAEETPEFIARNLVSRLAQYAETLKTPLFRRAGRLRRARQPAADVSGTQRRHLPQPQLSAPPGVARVRPEPGCKYPPPHRAWGRFLWTRSGFCLDLSAILVILVCSNN